MRLSTRYGLWALTIVAAALLGTLVHTIFYAFLLVCVAIYFLP